MAAATPLPHLARTPSTRLNSTPSHSGILLEASAPRVTLFGVEHLASHPAPARFVLDTKPGVVVVETAVDPAHGSETGACFSCESLDGTSAGFVGRTVCAAAARLTGTEYDSRPLWETLEGNLPGEQLVYVAALHVGADLVFGDRSKSETFVRVAEECSVEEVDEGLGAQVRANYEDFVKGGWIRERSVEAEEVGCVESIMLLEREATLCKTLRDVRERAGSGGVVGVVGAEHVNAMVEMWNSRTIETILHKAEERQMVTRRKKEKGIMAENIGIKHALLESLVTQSASPQVLVELRRELGDVPDEYQNDYWFMTEMYASTRMLLASLSEDELKQVCCGWRCNMWEVLEKYRKARPSNGACTVDLDIITELRGLEVNIQD